MILLRRELGDVLREQRQAQGRTLREVSAAASVSLGYLSEVERGEKEASSELLASICSALNLPLSTVLGHVRAGCRDRGADGSRLASRAQRGTGLRLRGLTLHDRPSSRLRGLTPGFSPADEVRRQLSPFAALSAGVLTRGR